MLAKKQLSLWSLPEVLVLGLKRFGQTDSLNMLGASAPPSFRQKLSRLVTFPLEGLDLHPYLPMEATSTTTRTLYDLVAVINHYGRMGFGHYTAVARDWAVDGQLAHQWLLFDDDRVEPIGCEDVVSAAAYVLFYRRRA